MKETVELTQLELDIIPKEEEDEEEQHQAKNEENVLFNHYQKILIDFTNLLASVLMLSKFYMDMPNLN